MHMHIIEACIKANSFRVKKCHNHLKVCSHLDPANPLYCILILFICTIYVSGKLGQGGDHTSKLKIVIKLFFKFLTRNKFALIHVSIICMCNKIKSKASIFQQYLLCLVV